MLTTEKLQVNYIKIGEECTFLVLKNIQLDKDVLNDHLKNIKCLFFGLDARKPVFGVCQKQRCRPACASAQTDQHLCFSLKVSYFNLLQAKFQFSS